MRIFLSPTTLSLFDECKRCFFDQLVLRQKRPRGAYPSLPNGVDAVLKAYTDNYRGSLPPELKNVMKSTGVLYPEQSAIETFRDWKEGLSATINISVSAPTEAMPNRKITHSIQFSGSIDDLLVDDSELHTTIDFKSKQKPPVEGEGERYYQVTMDSYAYLLNKMGMPSSDKAFLWYFWPTEIQLKGKLQKSIEHVSMSFGHKIVELKVDPQRIEDRIQAIAEMLPDISANAKKKQPPWNSECEYCTYRRVANV